MPVFVGAGTSSFMKDADGVGMSTATTTTRNAISGPRPGQMLFNHTTNLMEYYNGTAWIAIDTPPTVTSVNNTNILETQIASGFDLVITGTFFSSGATVTFIGNNGTEHASPTVTVNSTTQITARVHSSVSNSNEPYDVKVTNSSGLSSTLEDAFNVNAKPIWSTGSGTLTTINDNATGNHVTVSATDPEGDAVTYSETASVLSNAGLSLNSTTGVISGDPNDVTSSTTLSFTLRATSSGTNTTDRNFNIVVNPVNDGATAARASTSAKVLYTTGLVTSGKSMRYIDFGGSVGVKQVWCDFDTADASGGKGWMLCAKFTEASQWGGRDNDIRTTNAYVDPGDGYAISCNMGDANMNMMRITVEDSANQALGSSADADWYYEWTTTLPWKYVWQPAAGTGGGITLANGNLIYSSSSGGSGPRRTSLRKFQKSHNIKHNYTNTSHKFNNISDYGNNVSDTYVGSGSGVYGGDYHYITLGGGSDSPAAGTFDMWYALTTNNQKFRIHKLGRSANYQAASSPDTDGTIGMLANGSTKTHTGQDQDNENNVKIGYDDDQTWQHINTNPNDTGGTSGNKNTNASGKNMYWWIK